MVIAKAVRCGDGFAGTFHAVHATGAYRIQEVVFGVIPQVALLWSSPTLYWLETDVRSATTLGIVGAGGIGQTLYESLRSFQYADSAAQIIIVVVTVVAIGMASAYSQGIDMTARRASTLGYRQLPPAF